MDPIRQRNSRDETLPGWCYNSAEFFACTDALTSRLFDPEPGDIKRRQE